MNELQTAEAINAPQTGKIEVSRKPANPFETKTHTVKSPRPEGWWSFKAQGTRAAVIKAIVQSDIPEHRKAALIGDVQALPAKFNFVSIDAHCHSQEGKSVINETIQPSSMLVG